jgi:aminoglycoside phosphotransferase (APT) family kinase protein
VEEGQEAPSPSAVEWDLLQATVDRHIAPGARVRSASQLPIGSGMSGAAVRRYAVTYTAATGGGGFVTLVTKRAGARERRVLALLNAQGHAAVPFAHALAPDDEPDAPVCLQDVGDQRRPSSLDPIPDDLLDRGADGLAAIHAANLGGSDTLAWLPRADGPYAREMLERHTFWPAWTGAIADPGFVAAFGEVIAQVEAAAASIVADVDALFRAGPCSLIHTDINPSNVLVHGGIPYVIDWADAHYGPVFLDLPHHLPDLDQAERYRLALERRGIDIPRATFTERFRVAARYTGLRYIWWTIDARRDDPEMAPWVRHYLRLILDDDHMRRMP